MLITSLKTNSDLYSVTRMSLWFNEPPTLVSSWHYRRSRQAEISFARRRLRSKPLEFQARHSGARVSVFRRCPELIFSRTHMCSDQAVACRRFKGQGGRLDSDEVGNQPLVFTDFKNKCLNLPIRADLYVCNASQVLILAVIVLRTDQL